MALRLRPDFQCAHCSETFGYPVNLDHKGIIIVTCPFCGKTSKVDLDPYRPRPTDLYRGNSGETPNALGQFEFPEVIPTKQTESDNEE